MIKNKDPLQEKGKDLVRGLQEKGWRRVNVAQLLGVAPSTLNCKISGHNYFFQKDIELMEEILEKEKKSNP